MKLSQLAICAALSVQGANAAAKTMETWGKPGVSFADYRQESIDCAIHGYVRDVSRDEPAKHFLRGFATAERGLNDPNGFNDEIWRDAILMFRPDRLKRDVQAIQVGDVEACLTARGYRKFALSADEQRRLAKLRPGTDERRRFMHALAARGR